MKTITREGIQRMIVGKGSLSAGGSGAGGSNDVANMLAGYMTIEQAQQQFVSIDFFKRLFQAHGTDENDDPVDVDPNDTETTITDIEAMFGFWTEQYLSALGNGGGGGTGGATALTDLVDVAIASPTNGQALVYNSTTGKWTNQTISGGGVDMAAVWSALNAATNEQINASHLTNALSGYVTSQTLAGYLPLSGGAITGNLSVGGTLAVTGAATLSSSITAGSFIKSGGTSSQFLKADGSVDSNTYATQTWVDDNYVSIAFFSRLFKAYNGNTLVSPNNTTATIDNIKAMFGFWTEQYLSALGNGGGGGTGGATALTDLVDVAIASPTNGQALVYNATTSKWTNQTISGGGTDMATVWSNLAAATNEQINASHLTNALSGYATSSDLTGYLPLSGGTMQVGTNAYQTSKGINFGTGSHIGATASTLGLYCTGGIYLRPNVTLGASSSNGIVLTSTSLTYNGNTIYHSGNLDISNYLPLTGGTLSSTAVGVLKINKTNNYASLIGFYGKISDVENTEMGYIGCQAVDTPCFRTTGGTYYNLLHTGNFSSLVGSGLFTSLTSSNTTNLSVTIGGTTKSITDLYAYQSKNVRPRPMAAGDDYDTLSDYTITRGSFVAVNNNNRTSSEVTLDDLGTYDTLVSFGYNLRTIQFKGNAYGTMRLKYRRVVQPSSNVFAFSDWREIAFADGNIATATALATARTLWGQSFNGTANVSGNMTDVGTITGNGNITVTKTTTADTIISVTNSNGTVRLYTSTDRGLYDGTSGSTGWIIATNGTNTWMSRGNVGIGTTTPSYKLHVSGVSAAQSFRSTVETGTAPMVVASSTLVSNLNADLLDGKHSTDFASASDVTTLQGYFDSSGAANKAVQLKTARTLWGQSFDGTGNVTGAMTSVGSITCTNNSRISNATGSGGSLYIGRSDDAGWVKISDMCSRQGDSYWKIKSNGDGTFANVYSNGAVTALSDARHKTIVGDIDLTVEQIAAMPAIRYRWNDRRDNGLYVGSIAQDWQTILPEVVMTSDDKQRTLSLSYGVAALIASITTARKVVNHEERIAQLEKENMELRNELNRIKAA